MKIDNFNRIETYLKQDDPEFLYDVEILRRGKDHPELPAANWSIKSLHILGKDSLIKHADEIIRLCETFGARAYISLARKSSKKCMENALKCFAERLYDENYRRPDKIWPHAVGTTVPEEKIWILDVDTKDWDYVQAIRAYVENTRPNKNIIGIIPTINGFHIACHPFDRSAFNKAFKDVEIKEHSLTLLYA